MNWMEKFLWFSCGISSIAVILAIVALVKQ